MRMGILQIVIWPRKRELQPRVVPFELGKVNVISGASQTGKSALISIVDYCLGSGRCSIPVGLIRESCSWFGVVVQLSDKQVLFAREEPGTQLATDSMFMLEGAEIVLPSFIEKANANRGFVKSYLDEASGLSGLPLIEGRAGFGGRPSFRDLAAFNYQPQNIIANPQVLFYKTDSTEHKEKLRNVLPYALGITTPEVIAKQAQLAEERRQASSLRKQLDALRNNATQWRTELQINLARAQELGLISSATSLEITDDRALAMLRSVVVQAQRRDESPSGSSVTPSLSSAAREVTELRQREQEISFELSQLRIRLIEMTKLRDAAEAYSRALVIEEDRLGISRWLFDRSERISGMCPICGSGIDEAHSHLAELKANLEEVERGSASFRALPPSFDKEWSEVQKRIEIVTGAMVNVQRRIIALQEASETERHSRYTEMSVSRFIGKLEAGLSLYDLALTDDELRSKLSSLIESIRILENEVDEKAIAERKRYAIGQLAALMTPILQTLTVEDASDPAELVTTELSLRVRRAGRQDFLWEIGSASNWLGYHLAAALALHEFFMKVPSCPVPTYLMLDQPSQVYFPQKMAGTVTGEQLDPELSDDDEDRVRAIFKVLGDEVIKAEGVLQIIVVDHAGPKVWGALPGIHDAGDWRGDTKLVPSEWRAY